MRHHHIRQRLRLVTGMTVLSLILGACHGGSSGTAPYLPSAAPANHEQAGALYSSCGTHIRIVLAGIVNCSFREGGVRHDVFTLKNHTQGLVLISPLTGNERTQFTITGLVIGSGHFTVHDGKGDRLFVSVRVTL